MTTGVSSDACVNLRSMDRREARGASDLQKAELSKAVSRQNRVGIRGRKGIKSQLKRKFITRNTYQPLFIFTDGLLVFVFLLCSLQLFLSSLVYFLLFLLLEKGFLFFTPV